jgi:serine/threonine protein kinase
MELEGTTLGHYLLQRRLARGGMSEVYLAYDQSTQRTVAIKVVNRHRDDHMQRIQNEVKVLGILTHPHILPALEYGEEGPWCYFVMPYAEQGSLRECLVNGPLSQEEAGAILEQVASALQYLHSYGILHRDIKPANILFAHNQHVYLTDFGLSGKIDEGNNLTPAGCIIGTPEYMAPEMAEEPTSISSDIYSLGIVLYQMLTGRVPFKARTPLAVCWKHIQEQPACPSLLNPTISWLIEQVILCALEKDPRRRFPTVQAMVHAYNQATSQHNQTLRIAAPTIRLLKVRTQPGRSLRRRMPILPSMPHRTMHLAGSILIAALLFLILPLSLGFFLSGNGLQTQALTVSGASIVFAQVQNKPHNTTPHVQPTPSTQASASGYSSPQSNGQGSGRGYGQSSGRGHGHRHRHGHRHNSVSTAKEQRTSTP